MPPAVDEQIKRKVIQQWICGCPRDKIAEANNIGTGTVTSIISSYKTGLDNSDFESVRDLAVELRKQGLALTDLASDLRLYNYFRKSGATKDEIESFIAKVHSNEIPSEKVVELVNQLFDISKSESLPLEGVPSYIKQKLEEKQKIDNEVKVANSLLESKNVSLRAINEHLKLKEELDKHGLSTHNIDKLLNLIVNAKVYGFDSKKIISKLHSMERLERKEKGLENNCVILSKQIAKYKDIMPLTEDVAALGIGIDELIALKAGINQAVKHYDLPPLAATLQLIDEIKNYNKIGGLKKQLSELYLRKFAINEACVRQSQALINLAKLQSYGITENKLILLSKFLESNSRYETY